MPAIATTRVVAVVAFALLLSQAAGALAAPHGHLVGESAPAVAQSGSPLRYLDLADALEARIEKGEVTLEQGLIETLAYLAGERPGPPVPPETLASEEAEGIYRMASTYLRDGRDPSARREIARLIGWGEAAASGSAVDAGVSRAPSGAGEFPCHEALEEAGSGWGDELLLYRNGLVDCIEHSKETIGGQDYAVYLPAAWAEPGAGWGSTLVEPVEEALHHSVEVFGGYGTLAPIHLFFADVHQDERLGGTKAEAPEGSPYCVILVFSTLLDSPLEEVQQTVAHEVFHCFQYVNFDFSKDDFESLKWWIEGTAVYFSNVAYPSANEEWRWIKALDALIGYRPLTSMGYTTWIFFQYLGFIVGNDEILKLVASLPMEGSEGQQQEALKAFPGFDEYFQGFAQAYMDGSIEDTSGELIPVHPGQGEVYEIHGSGPLELDVPPFYVKPSTIVFDPGVKWSTSWEELGASSKHGVQPAGQTGFWGELPGEIDCQAARRFVVVQTSTALETDAGAGLRFDISASTSECEEATCEEAASAPAGLGKQAAVDCEPDPCLLGEWEPVDILGYLTAFVPTLAELPIEEATASGVLRLIFDETDVTIVADEFELAVETDIDGTPAVVVVRFDGTTTAPYHVEPGGHGVVTATGSTLSVTATVTIGGQEMPTQEVGDEFIPIVGGSFDYTCGPDELMITEAGKPPITLRRMS
jgi:hypothetical protein